MTNRDVLIAALRDRNEERLRGICGNVTTPDGIRRALIRLIPDMLPPKWGYPTLENLVGYAHALNDVYPSWASKEYQGPKPTLRELWDQMVDDPSWENIQAVMDGLRPTEGRDVHSGLWSMLRIVSESCALVQFKKRMLQAIENDPEFRRIIDEEE